jgi:16S rRNA A1518/A1519 N6-dimethyltransferase RsmA/KsgA/DIM1 with predicted DNA glycosylase/AP lyase activity
MIINGQLLHTHVKNHAKIMTMDILENEMPTSSGNLNVVSALPQEITNNWCD